MKWFKRTLTYHFVTVSALLPIYPALSYIISGLQTDEGLHLMEILARRANIQMIDFAELSYV